MHAEVAPEPEAPTDLMQALRASVEAARRRGSSLTADESDGDLERLSREELYELAKKADIPGRSDMSKKQLVKALEQAA